VDVSNGTPADEASVSGALEFWGLGDQLAPENLGESGVMDWFDSGPKAQDTAQLTAGLRPNVASGQAPNGENALYFDGTEYLNTASVLHSSIFNGNDKPITVIVAANPQSLVNSNLYALGNTAATTPSLRCGIISSQLRWYKEGTTAVDVRAGTPTEAKHVFSWVSSGVTTQLYIDGAEVTVAPSGSDISSIAPNTSTIGSVILNNVSSNQYTGFIYEVAIYSSGLAASQRLDVERGMAYKYGIHI